MLNEDPVQLGISSANVLNERVCALRRFWRHQHVDRGPHIPVAIDLLAFMSDNLGLLGRRLGCTHLLFLYQLVESIQRAEFVLNDLDGLLCSKEILVRLEVPKR